MKKLLGVLLCVFSMNTAWALHLPAFEDLPVQWKPKELWQWQGQTLLSQRFSSTHDVATLAALIQQRVEPSGLRIQRMSSSWLLSFDHFSKDAHYLLLLSAQPNGSQGWFSAMQLPNTEQNNVMPPALFTGLYQHSWSIGHQENEAGSVYFVLQPILPEPRFWQHLKTRLQGQLWQEQGCEVGQWCRWHKEKQQLWLWVDAEQGLWHVLLR